MKIKASNLKFIATISMIVDHLCKGLLSYKGIEYSSIFTHIGKIAFPLYTFLLVESFYKTRSRSKTLINILALGILSELPFDLCFYHEINWYHQNIFFTMSIMFILMLTLEHIKINIKNEGIKFSLYILVTYLSIFITSVCFLDWGYQSILLTLIYYISYNFKNNIKVNLISNLLALILIKDIAMILVPLLLYFYNGERGNQNKLFNYLFYPIHLIIIFLLTFI